MKHELMQKHKDHPATECPACKGYMKKLISSTSFVLKGTGWYKTDYAASASSDAVQTKKPAKPEKDAAVKAEPKTEDKPEAAAKT